MKLIMYVYLIACCLAPRIAFTGEPTDNQNITIPIESHFAAYGLGRILHINVDSRGPNHGLASILMHENIGREITTNRFVVSISPLTAARAFPQSDNGSDRDDRYLPPSQWPANTEQLYFVVVARRSNDYFLTSIDDAARWEETQSLKAYLASGQFSKDNEKAKLLNEELESLRQEMSRTLAKLDPNITDDEYSVIMGPLEKREKELSAAYYEVWSRMKYVPFDADNIEDQSLKISVKDSIGQSE